MTGAGWAEVRDFPFNSHVVKLGFQRLLYEKGYFGYFVDVLVGYAHVEFIFEFFAIIFIIYRIIEDQLKIKPVFRMIGVNLKTILGGTKLRY